MFKGKRITLATFKSFVNKNRNNLYVRNDSSFDGMIDGIQYDQNSKFRPVVFDQTKLNDKHTLGFERNGIWLVNQGRDYFQAFENDAFVGIEVSNSCGSFVVAVKKD